MKAVRCHRYGSPGELADVLAVEELPDPVPGEGQVVVAVAAAAVNFTDVLFVGDGYQVSMPLPFTPGSEVAGVVAEVGPGVAGVGAGDPVVASTFAGGFAEKVLVPAAAVRRLPAGADLAVAAASGVASATAYSALRTTAEVRPGEWVVITGAAGGVGSAAVTLAREFGARSLAVVSGPEKASFCEGLGADAVLDLSGAPDVKSRVREITGGGADVVLDVVGGDLAETLLRATRRRGRFVTLGYASGTIPRIPLNLVLLKDVRVLGFDLRGFTELEPELAARDAAGLAALQERGIGATVTARYPLERAAEALAAIADRTVTGKVVVTPGG
ncbi:zinc-binding dehydrogenase [Spirillospora sp. NPDC029432]|uniref:zinc-binding dehydrogenase n=1 Tax=Spirillospora sp. NPDC029432 TaxID=3154599 RepID=UPI003453058D